MKIFYTIIIIISIFIGCDPMYTTSFIFNAKKSITIPSGEIISTDMSYDDLIVIVDSICTANKLINDGRKLLGSELVSWHPPSVGQLSVGIIQSDSLSETYEIRIMSFGGPDREMTPIIRESLTSAFKIIGSKPEISDL